jgi:tagatose-1,6-bisphosphate aldolase
MTIGKWRRIEQTATAAGAFAILALDHRIPMRRSLEEVASRSVTDDDLAAIKDDIVRALAPETSAVLLDPETAAGSCIASEALPAQTGLIVTLDTGSTGDPQNHSVPLIEGWSADKVARLGASAAKLLLYYHPKAPHTAASEDLITRTGADCQNLDLPFFLEPLLYHPQPPHKPLSSLERRTAAVDMVGRLSTLGPDVLKVEFPLNITDQPDEKEWRSACEEITAASNIPWVLLSGGVSFETFLRQVQVACEAGASGVMAGRAVWADANTLNAEDRIRFLQHTARDRMHHLRHLCDKTARPFTEKHEPPSLSRDWYKTY